MKTTNLFLLFVIALSISTAANAAGSMLRVACDGSNKVAEVEVNGKFKGQCPLDLQVPEGMVNLKVRQVIDDLEERVYEEKMRIGDGVVKKVDVILGPSQLSQKGYQYLDRYWAATLHEDEQRANSGDPQAMMAMANHYTSGYHNILQRSKEKMILWIKKAADAGHPEAMQRLGEFFAKGDAGFPKNEEQSQAWRLRAAEAGNQHAIAQLAFAYSLGELGLQKDEAQRAVWSRKLFEATLKEAEAGDPSEMKEMGIRYRQANGVEFDLDEGNKWLQRSAATYRKLANAGDWRAMEELSEVIVDENGEEMSPEQKQYWSELGKARIGQFHDFKELRAFVRRTDGASK